MNKTKEVYWSQVGKRLKNLLNIALEASIPLFIETSINKVCAIIETKIHSVYKSTIINSLITLGMNICGMMIVICKPFGTVISNFIAPGLFLTSIIFFCFRFAMYWRNYGKTTIEVGKSIFVKKSVSKGIEEYFYTQFPAISLAYLGLDIAAKYLPALKQIPSLSKTIKLIIQMFWKRLLVFGVIVGLYSIAVYWIAKPMLLNSLTDLKWYEIYFYPIYHFILLIKI